MTELPDRAALASLILRAEQRLAAAESSRRVAWAKYYELKEEPFAHESKWATRDEAMSARLDDAVIHVLATCRARAESAAAVRFSELSAAVRQLVRDVSQASIMESVQRLRDHGKIRLQRDTSNTTATDD